MAKHSSILGTIGNTPLVRLQRLAPEGINLYVKVESFNPMASVKDRMALAVIERAERLGELKPGQTVIEATSGNTGIGLAMVCASKGYPLVCVMSETFSVERRKLLRFLGAKVVLTPASEKGSGMLAKAIELAQAHGWYLCRQFENEANADVHMRTTAREILADFQDEPLHYFVTGFGTGGTLLGVGRVLRHRSPQTKIVAAEPDNAQVLGSGIPQAREADGRPSSSHPMFRPHLMQGWAPDFISRLTESAVAERLVDEVVPVAGRRRHEPLARARAQGRHLRRHVERRHARRRPHDREAVARGHEHRVHAAGYRRALHVDAALRGHRRGDGRGRARDLALHGRLPLRSAGGLPAARRQATGSVRRARSRGGALRRRAHRERARRPLRARVV
jgi:cysteine synthase